MGHHLREQENCVSTRRQALGSIGLGVAVAALPICALALAAELHPDAELIRLGAAFDRCLAAWGPLWSESRRLEKMTSAAMRAAGVPFDLAMYQRLCEKTGFDAAADANDAAVDRLNQLSEKIAAIPARTAAGIHVKARVLFFECVRPAAYIGVQEEAFDGDVLAFRAFLAELARLAGEVRP